MSDSVKFTPEREVRFAVVMYGGVSLAIYINGVAQELLSLVRATAPKTADEKSPDFGDALLGANKEELSGSLAVYRKLGQYLEDKNAKLKETAPTQDPIRTRFVVDVISGTSAGGINGVFLAQALARDQNMDGLKKLWLSEGDLDKLLNDKGSLGGLTGFKIEEPQTSLLNSQRMYRKLLEALDTMEQKEKGRPETELSPLVGELDLFITTTDIEGIPLPIMLSDEVVYERRFKNVFHFRYATEEATGSARDDFVKANDPFLAFAARCTSSFPFAFEAMCLKDIAEGTKNFPAYIDKSETEAWDTFYGAYLRNALYDINQKARGGKGPTLPRNAKGKEDLVKAKTNLRAAFRNRAFGDGEYLDNKPFSYATSMLMRRSADCIVSRKLLYVEPSPQHPELMPTDPTKPDFAQNIRAAVLDLPRQETIREDIERLYQRNEMIERLTIFAKHVDEDMLLRKQRSMTRKQFGKAGLKQMIELYGVSYGAYHRLKIEEITTLLAALIARAAGHDPTSDAADAIRELVTAWRKSKFHPLTSDERTNPVDKDKQTENQFLLDFDIRYKLRRFAFLNRRVNQLAPLDDAAKASLDACFKQLPLWPTALTAKEVGISYRAEFVTELNRIKKEMLAPETKSARSAEEKLIIPTSDTGKLLYAAIGKLHIAWEDGRDSGLRRRR